METDERLMRLARPKIFKGLFSGNVEIEQGATTFGFERSPLRISNSDA